MRSYDCMTKLERSERRPELSAERGANYCHGGAQHGATYYGGRSKVAKYGSECDVKYCVTSADCAAGADTHARILSGGGVRRG